MGAGEASATSSTESAGGVEDTSGSNKDLMRSIMAALDIGLSEHQIIAVTYLTVFMLKK